MNLVLPHLYPKQHAAFFNDAKVAVCEASTKAGKTVGALAWLIEGAVRFPNQSSLWVSPIYPQARMQGFERMARILRDVPGIQTNKTELTITWSNGHKHYFKGTENPDSVYGADYVRAVADEFSRCKAGALAAILSTLTATKGQFRAIGNVKGRSNEMYKLARQGEQGDPTIRYHKIIAPDAVEAGVLDAETIEFSRKTLPNQVYRELYFCEPSDDGGNPFGLQHIARNVRPISDRPTVAYGADLAKSYDWTVVYGVDALGDCSYFDRWQGVDWSATTERVSAAIGSTPALIDYTGVGAPVVDRLQENHPNVEPFTFTQSSKQTLMGNLAVEIQNDRAGVPDNEIRKELEVFEYVVTNHGRVSYSAPQGLHDDCVCAMALAHQMKRQHVPVDIVWGESRPMQEAGMTFAQRRAADPDFGFEN